MKKFITSVCFGTSILLAQDITTVQEFAINSNLSKVLEQHESIMIKIIKNAEEQKKHLEETKVSLQNKESMLLDIKKELDQQKQKVSELHKKLSQLKKKPALSNADDVTVEGTEYNEMLKKYLDN